jgi:putative addiction module component (TIGR02574 family)
MSVDLQALGIDRLSISDKLELIEQIWNSLPEQVDTAEIPPWHLVELAKRRQEAEQHPGVGKPWREVMRTLESES